MRRVLNSKLTFSDPYVIRTQVHDSALGRVEGVHFFSTLQRAKKIYTQSTWAYSNPEYEARTLPSEHDMVVSSGNHTQRWPTVVSTLVSYWAFKDEQDALQFRLVFGEHARHVHMWDQRIRFTVIEHE